MSDRVPAKRKGSGAARGYSWAPFQPGNKQTMTHGARSRDPELFRGRAEELAAAVFEANGHLDRLRDGPAVMRLAVTSARIERVYSWLSEQADAVFSDVETGAIHAVYQRLGEWESRCSALEAHLAINPLTRAKLGLTKMTAQALAEGALAEFMAEQGDD